MSNSLLLKGGRLLDLSSGYNLESKDVYIKDGIIHAIEENVHAENDIPTINLKGQIIAPGFIDIHTHVYDKCELGVNPDKAGIEKGTTTLFDAGSSGSKNFKDFLDNYIKKSKTSIFVLLNIAYNGLENSRYELADRNNIRIDEVKETVNRYGEYIKGIKARASATTVGELGIKPIEIAKKTAADLKLPLVVHIGNYPPFIDDVLSIMDKGDVITHCFHGKENGLLDLEGNVKRSTEQAIQRGVLFDVGHGTSSFNFNTAKKAIAQGFYPNIISTDMHRHNIEGPVYNLQRTMDKIMALGEDIGTVVRDVTTAPAEAFKLQGFGKLAKGYLGDLTIFNIVNESKILEDADGNNMETDRSIRITKVIKNGKKYSIFND